MKIYKIRDGKENILKTLSNQKGSKIQCFVALYCMYNSKLNLLEKNENYIDRQMYKQYQYAP